MNYSILLDSISNEMDATNPSNSLLRICESLNLNVKSCDWVGFYLCNHENKTLHLGPYIGEKTDHTVIPFGKGICGQVADSGKTYIAKDINEESNYIACSIKVKSEIVIPIYNETILAGQLDIDSHSPNSFGEEERKFLEDLCVIIGSRLGPKLQINNFPFS